MSATLLLVNIFNKLEPVRIQVKAIGESYHTVKDSNSIFMKSLAFTNNHVSYSMALNSSFEIVIVFKDATFDLAHNSSICKFPFPLLLSK